MSSSCGEIVKSWNSNKGLPKPTLYHARPTCHPQKIRSIKLLEELPQIVIFISSAACMYAPAPTLFELISDLEYRSRIQKLWSICLRSPWSSDDFREEKLSWWGRGEWNMWYNASCLLRNLTRICAISIKTIRCKEVSLELGVDDVVY